MIHLLIALLLCMLLGGCGYNPECISGCPQETPETVEVVETIEVQGPPGPRGEVGPRGSDGNDGRSCTVSQLDGGVSVECPNGDAIIRNGEDGQNGLNPKPVTLPPGTIVDIINPCGDSGLDEVILVTEGGTLIGHYSDGKRQHLTVLVPGTYTTTQTKNGSECRFSVDAENNLTWEVGE